MAGRKLHRWVFAWLCQWCPGRVHKRRRPIFRDVRPMLEKLEDRWSPTSMSVAPPVELARPRFSQEDGARIATGGESWTMNVRAEEAPSVDIPLRLSALPVANDNSGAVSATARQPGPDAAASYSEQGTTATQALSSHLSARPFTPLSSAPPKKPMATPANANGSGGGNARSGASTPNAGKGGGGPTGGGGGPGVVNADNFIGVNFGQPGNAAAPTSDFSYQAAFFSPASSDPGAGSASPQNPTPTASTQGGKDAGTSSAGPQIDSPVSTRQPGNPQGGASLANTGPLYVIDLNTGETIPGNATLNTFAGWSENLLAQVSGVTVSSYSWNLSNAPDFLTLGGASTTSLQTGTWQSTGDGKTESISVTETPTSGSAVTLTFDFKIASSSSPAYSSRPTTSATWANVLTPDLIQGQQATQPGGPDADLGLADGSVQTSFSMPSYNPNVDPLRLDYSSTAASAQPIFLVHYQLGATVPSLVTAQLTLDNTLLTTVTYNPSNLNPSDWMQMALQADATGLSSGRYPYSISINNGSSTTTYSGSVDIVNEAGSPYGAGWSLDNEEQLVSVSGGMMLVQPGGTSLFFASSGSSYTTPAGNFSTLASNGSGYTQTLPDGTKINFNSSGRQTSIVDTNSNTTSFSYNSSNLLTSISDMNGQQTTLAYNNSNQLTSITDPASRAATLAYSSSGNQLTSITDPASEVWQYGYNSAAAMTTLTDPRGNTTTFSYDFADRVTSVTQPDSTTMSLVSEQINGLAASGSSNVTATLLAMGDLAQYTDALGNVWTTELGWSGFGLDIQDDDPLGDTAFTYRDTNGLPWMSSDGLARRTRGFFNSQGNATLVVAPDDTKQTFAYNSFSEVTQYTDQLGNITTNSYDSKGNLTQITDALNEVTTMAYNSAGLPTSMTDPAGNTSTYAYDSLNRLTKMTDPLGNATTFAYNSASDLTGTTDARGFTSTYSYDSMNDLTGQTVEISSGSYATTTFAYDKYGNLTAQTDPLGNQTTFGYNALNEMTGQTDALSHQTTFGYDANGNLTAQTDALGHQTTYGYDAANRPTSVTDPAGDQTTVAYDAAGEVTSATDPMGNTTTTTYTPTGQVSVVTDPMGNQTSYVYDKAGKVTSETVTPAGSGGGGVGGLPGDGPQEQTWNYNAVGEVTAFVDGAGNQTTYAYDKDRNLTAQTDALGHQSTYSYDKNGNLTSATDPLGDQTTYGYDQVGNQTLMTDPLGKQTTYSYDGMNRLTSETSPLDGVTTYGYDKDGNLTSLTDPDSNQTTYGYNQANLLTKTTDPLSHSSTYAYDAANELTSSTDADGRTITYAYDLAGRLTGETWVGGSYTATLSYNKDGLVTEQQDPFSTYSYTYNADSEETSVDNAGTPGVPTVTLSLSYDGIGNLTGVTDSKSGSLGYSYNGDDQLSGLALTVNSALDAKVTFAYDAATRLTGITMKVGALGSDTLTSSLSYDNANRLTNITDTDVTKSTTLANYTYSYNKASELTGYQDNSGNSLSYGYDAAGELTSASGTLVSQSYTFTYDYDKNGNRTTTTTDVGGSLSSATYSTGTGNELLNDGTYTYTYDNDGNMTSQTNLTTSSVTYYTWDYENRLTEVKQETSSGTVIYDEKFTYDVNGNRIGESLNGTQELYTVYLGSNPYMDFNGSGTLTERYLFNPQGLNQFYGQVNGSGTTQWFLTDNIGSIRQVVSTSGSVLDAITYDPYGNILNQTNAANAPRFLYAGGAYDSLTGNYQFDARPYSSADGHFLTQDWKGFAAGDNNLYRYVFNAPIDHIDPSGMQMMTMNPGGYQNYYGYYYNGRYGYYYNGRYWMMPPTGHPTAFGWLYGPPVYVRGIGWVCGPPWDYRNPRGSGGIRPGPVEFPKPKQGPVEFPKPKQGPVEFPKPKQGPVEFPKPPGKGPVKYPPPKPDPG